jgi:diketogulonate reductase-like aldo/keto reductase
MRLVLILGSIASAAAVAIPNVQLQNAAKAGQVMPAMGLGTFGYATTPTNGDCRSYPECWDTRFSPLCGPVVTNTTGTFLQLAESASSPIRIDSANDYFDMAAVGAAISSSGVARSNLFVTSKIGNAFAMG